MSDQKVMRLQHCLIWIFLCVAVFPTGVFGQKINRSLLVVYDRFPPSTMAPSSKDPRIGFANELIQLVFTGAGYEIEFLELPVPRAHAYLRSGKAQILAETNPQIAPEFLYPEMPTFRHENVFWVRTADQWSYSGYRSLTGRKFGTVLGYDYLTVDDELDAFLKTSPGNVLRVGSADAVERLFKMLALGRIDTMNESDLVGEYLLSQLGLRGQIKRAGQAKLAATYRPAFDPNNKHSPELIKIWDAGRRAVSLDGRDNEILSKYGIENSKNPISQKHENK